LPAGPRDVAVRGMVRLWRQLPSAEYRATGKAKNDATKFTFYKMWICGFVANELSYLLIKLICNLVRIWTREEM
jgi:hypothetical protein